MEDFVATWKKLDPCAPVMVHLVTQWALEPAETNVERVKLHPHPSPGRSRKVLQGNAFTLRIRTDTARSQTGSHSSCFLRWGLTLCLVTPHTVSTGSV